MSILGVIQNTRSSDYGSYACHRLVLCFEAFGTSGPLQTPDSRRLARDFCACCIKIANRPCLVDQSSIFIQSARVGMCHCMYVGL